MDRESARIFTGRASATSADWRSPNPLAGAVTQTPPRDSTTSAQRARFVEEAVHSLRMEGLDLAAVSRAVAAAYVAGRITVDEYGRRIRARFGASTAAPPVALTVATRGR